MAKDKEVVEKTTKKTNDNITKVKTTNKNKPVDDIVKVNLDDQPVVKEEKVENQNTEDIVVVNEEPKVETKEQEDVPVVEDVTNEEIVDVQKEIEDTISESQATGKPLPEKVEKLISFMEETGGDLTDYVKLNKDTSKMDDSEILDEYYRNTKSHLSPEERSFLLEDTFGFDEEVDEPRDIKKKKIALKEQVAEAKAHLDGQKSKYYEEIKAGSKLTQEQQKAINFFNRYNKNDEQQKKNNKVNKSTFLKRTDKVFNKDFKGFDYQVGDKKFRFNVKDVNKVKETQSDLNNFVNKFVGDNNDTIEDAAGYHKSLFTAMNADAIAKHFYEQGKSDAIKNTVAKDKNINLDPRKTHGETEVGGVKYRVLGDSANDFKFKIKSKNKK